jgi:hypothetical protein
VVGALVTPAKLFLGAVLLALLVADAIALRKRARRALLVEVVVFLVGGFMVALPETTTWVATKLGVSRGVDLVLYVLVILLVREAILNRSARLDQEEKMTELVRALALKGVRRQREP